MTVSCPEALLMGEVVVLQVFFITIQAQSAVAACYDSVQDSIPHLIKNTTVKGMQPLHKIFVICKGCIPLTHGVKMNDYFNEKMGCFQEDFSYLSCR